MYLGPVCRACKYTLSRNFFVLDAADERNLIKLGMHFQAKLPNFEGPQRFYFVLGPCVKYRSSISSASSLLTTQNEFSIVSRKRDRLSAVQIKHSMGFCAFPQTFWEAQTFPEERGGIQLHSSGNWILPLHGTSLGSAICQRNPHARHVCGDAGERRWTSTACVAPWGEHGAHPPDHTADLRNSDSRAGYLDTLALTRLSFCATQPSRGCSPVSTCTLSKFGLEWVTSREKAALEEAGLVTQWVTFFPLSQYWTKHPHVVLRRGLFY